MFRLSRYGSVLVVLLGFSVSQSTHAVESGWPTLPFAGANGARGAAENNGTFTTKEGIVFVHAPNPKYPFRAEYLRGRTVVRLKLDRKSGRVLSVALIQGTGQELLDHAALKALKRWQARPGVKLASVVIPVVFAGPRSHSRYGG